MKSVCRFFALAVMYASCGQAETLPRLNLDGSNTTVSGLSSGAFMAVQLQFAYSSRIAGAGVVAGGPFGCADGNVYRAVRVCMNAYLGEADPQDSIREINELAEEMRIDDATHVMGQQMYLFHGRADDTVAQSTMNALNQTYLGLGVPTEQIVYHTNVNAGHGFVTEQGDLTCSTTGPDFLIDCDFDQAGDLLVHLYGDLKPPQEAIWEHLVEFDQTQYLQGTIGMDASGFVYVPSTCASGATCRLHIALHGCQQGKEVLGADYARLTGYNRWAEANDIVVLYPQAKRIAPPWWNLFGGNPNGCWDWWGYAGNDYLSREAPQMAAIARMTEALGASLTD